MKLSMEITQDGERWVLEVKEWDDQGLLWREDRIVGVLADVQFGVEDKINHL